MDLVIAWFRSDTLHVSRQFQVLRMRVFGKSSGPAEDRLCRAAETQDTASATLKLVPTWVEGTPEGQYRDRFHSNSKG